MFFSIDKRLIQRAQECQHKNTNIYKKSTVSLAAVGREFQKEMEEGKTELEKEDILKRFKEVNSEWDKEEVKWAGGWEGKDFGDFEHEEQLQCNERGGRSKEYCRKTYGRNVGR